MSDFSVSDLAEIIHAAGLFLFFVIALVVGYGIVLDWVLPWVDNAIEEMFKERGKGAGNA